MINVEQDLDIQRLQHRLVKTDRTLARVAEKRTRLSSGEYPINPRYDLSGVTGIQRSERVFNRIQSVVHYDEKVTPRLQAYHQKLTDTIQTFVQLADTFSRLDDAVKLGRISREIADETKIQLLTPLKRETTMAAPDSEKEPERGKKLKAGSIDFRGQREIAKIMLPDGKIISSVGFLETKILQIVFPEVKPIENHVIYREQLLQDIYKLTLEESKGTKETANLDSALYRVRLMLNERGWTLNTVRIGEKGSKKTGYIPLKKLTDKGNLITENIIIPDADIKELEEATEQTEQRELFPLTSRQITIICTEIQRKNGRHLRHGGQVIRFDVNNNCLKLCRELDRQHETAVNTTANGRIDLKTERDEALGAMRDLVETVVNEDGSKGKLSEKDPHIFDRLPANIQDLVIQFLEWEDKFSATNLYAFLAAVINKKELLPGAVGYDEACVREFKGSEKVWDTPHPFPVKKKEAVVVSTTELTNAQDISSGNNGAASVEKIDYITEITTDSCEKTKMQMRKQTSVEKRQQKEKVRRERIRECLTQIREVIGRHELMFDGKGVAWGGARVTRAFNWLTRTVQDDLGERKLIKTMMKSGSRNSGHVRGFTLSDIAIALYFHEYDRQITPKIAHDLEIIIAEELAQVE